jgi:glycosyltransferase involved in cell wall biosynthesis
VKTTISVIICTHNPKIEYLARSLDALYNQNVPKTAYDITIIDNASSQPLMKVLENSGKENQQIIREDTLGLTAARIRGIQETKGELLVFVDDDNILESDYLQETLRIAEEWPELGVWGGSITAEFECSPDPVLGKYLSGLAVEEIHQDYWSNIPVWCKACPFGAGMVVRRSVADAYLKSLTHSPEGISLGRTGKSLSSGEDTHIAYTACDIGFGMGRFKSLKLVHIISKPRLTESYILKLNQGFVRSFILLDAIRGKRPGNPDSILLFLRRFLMTKLRLLLCRDRQKHFDLRVYLNKYLSEQDTLKSLLR